MGLLGKLIAGKVMAKVVKKLNHKSAALDVRPAVRQGQYIPASGGKAVTPSGLAGKAIAFYEKNPKLVAGATTLLMAAVAASLSKGRKPY